MVPGSAPGGSSREADLTTSSAEQRTRTYDVVPAGRAAGAGPATGDVLRNRFVLHQCLADGATSRLFRALDRRREAAGDPDPWVVLKIVTAPPAAGPGHAEPRALQALRREAAIAQGLDHPNLPRIVGIDHDGPHTFVCMAWIEGESLAAILDSRGARPMTRVQALPIVEAVGRALIHLHAQGITHADVKPGNILVTAQGSATLLDFGVALGPGAGDLPAARGFTPEYASPEVLAGDDPTPSDDLFSLACVAYRMLGGHRAFGPVTARDAAAADSRPVRPDHLSPAQWRALDRALAFARADRQPDVATFLTQLKGARDESNATTELPAPEPVAAAGGTVSSAPEAGTGRRRPGQATLMLGAAVAATLAAGAWWLQRAPAPGPDPVRAGQPAAPAAEEPPAIDLPAERVAGPQPEPAPAGTPAAEAPPATASGPPLREPGPSGPAAPGQRPAVALPERAPEAAPVSVPESGGAAAEVRRLPPAELAGPPVPEPVSPTTGTGPATVPVPAGPATDSPEGNPSGSPATVPFSSLTVRRYAQPSYPRNAAARRVAGWVDVAFTVDPSGRTRDVRVAGADPPGVFDDAAMAAVRRWRFAAPDANGSPAAGPVNTKVRVRFDPR